LGAQFLYRGATQYGDNGVYVSLEEPTHSIANTMLRFNWNLFDLESQGKLVLVDAAPRQERPGSELKISGGVLGTEAFDLDGLLGVIAHARKQVAAKRCVIDSLETISGVYESESEYRYKLLQFFRALSELELTTLVLTDTRTPTVDHFGVETMLACGCFILATAQHRDASLHRMELLKVRGIRAERRELGYRITSDGFEVHPGEPT
jgi:KaiC/GvpD/RAD55 family RecA-like ATPase